jgi:hypothetical protein
MLTNYQDFSYAEDNYVTSGTYKVPLVHKLNKKPDTIQRVPPSREQRVLDLLVHIRRNRSSAEGLEGQLQRL